MASPFKDLVPPVLLTTSTDTQYTAPLSTKAVITAATITNSTGTSRTATVYLVPSGGSAGASTTIISAKAITPGDTYVCLELIGKVIEPSGSIQTVASANSALTFQVSGVETA